MRTSNLSLLVFGLLAASLSSSPLHADGRSFVWTYQHQTMTAGHAEVEYYTTFTSPLQSSLAGTTTASHQIELEIGMNDQFDVGLYQKFKQGPGGSFFYDGFKIRTRYRIGERGDFFVDPLIYLEYGGKQDFSEHALEGKLVLSKNIGNIFIAINPTVEIEMSDESTTTDFRLAGGAGYSFHPIFRAGFEFAQTPNGTYVGPTISHGREELWFALGLLRAITETDPGVDRFKLRLIVGVGL